MNLSVKTDLWTYLTTVDKPILMYGMGNGADKILRVCETYGIEIADFFASDGFVRGQLFRGKRVKSFSEVKAEYADFIILVAFASRQSETVEMLYAMSEAYELYAPDVNVSGDYTEVFDSDFYSRHHNELYSAMMMLEECSREVFCRILDFKMSGKLKYLREADSLIKNPHKLYRTDLIHTYADLGAYTGDTLKSAVELYTKLESAILMEPDEKNFKKLSAYADTLEIETRAYNNAAWSCTAEMTVHMGFGMNTTLGNIAQGLQKKKEKLIRTLPLDSITDNADLIKYDVEGSELEALEGSKKLITGNRPVLIVSVYHNNNDLYKLPGLIKSYSQSYKLYLNRKPCIPAWELEIIAVDEKYAIQGEQNV